jgi:hypothetical protein
VRKSDDPIVIGHIEVVVNDAGQPYRLWYLLRTIAAWVFAASAFGSASSDAPRRPYMVVVREREQSEPLYVEGPLYGDEASDTARQFAADIKRVGIDDFVFKRSQGWRID